MLRQKAQNLTFWEASYKTNLSGHISWGNLLTLFQHVCSCKIITEFSVSRYSWKGNPLTEIQGILEAILNQCWLKAIKPFPAHLKLTWSSTTYGTLPSALDTLLLIVCFFGPSWLHFFRVSLNNNWLLFSYTQYLPVYWGVDTISCTLPLSFLLL